ncbi:MmgE/PrpD family protein [Colwellia sp. MEBiC06753]
MSLTAELTRLLSNKRFCADDYQRAYLHVIDWLGCAAAGANTDAGKAFQASLVLSQSGNCNAIFLGHFDWLSAALYNGALGNILEMDDIHRSSILHPGPVIIPSALAIAQQQGVSFHRFLEAIILGYEIAIRVGQAIGRSHYRHFHNTATCAAFGATYACCYLFDCDDKQIVSALGNLGSRTSGLWQMRHENVMTKQWHNASASQMSAQVAWLAKCGVSGVNQILEGESGVFNVLSTDADTSYLVATQPNWLIYDTSFKPWPACRHAHPAIDAFLRCQHKLPRGAEITQVSIATYQDALTFCDKTTPTTTIEAKFSIQHAIAAIIVWGEPELAHYQSSVLDASEVIQARAKVQLNVSSQHEDNYPGHFGASCQISYQLGQQSGQVNESIKDTLGDPEVPMSAEHIKAKARYLLTQSNIPEHTVSAINQFSFDENTKINAFSQLISPVGAKR